MDVTATFMGAHLVPAEYKQDRAEYIRLVCEEMMPAVKEQGIAKFCDVFCEADTFYCGGGPSDLEGRPRAMACAPRSTPTRSRPSAALSWPGKSVRSPRNT